MALSIVRVHKDKIMSEKLSHQDQLNISVQEQLSKLSIKEKYVLTKKVRSDALISIGAGVGVGILFVILALTINRAFYYGFVFSLIGIVRGLIYLTNPTRAIRSKLSQTIQESDKNLSKGIDSERRKKQKRVAIVWFSFLGLFVLFIAIFIIAVIASSK